MNHWCIWALCELKAPLPPVLCLLQSFLLLYYKGYSSKRKAFFSYCMQCNSWKRLTMYPPKGYTEITMIYSSWTASPNFCFQPTALNGLQRNLGRFSGHNFMFLCFFVCVLMCTVMHPWVLLDVVFVEMFKSWISEWPNEIFLSTVCAFVGPQVTRSSNLIRFQPNTPVSLFECVSAVSSSNCLGLSLSPALMFSIMWPVSDPTSPLLHLTLIPFSALFYSLRFPCLSPSIHTYTYIFPCFIYWPWI